MDVFNLSASLTLDTSQYMQALAQAESAGKKATGKMGGASGGLGGLGSAVQSLTEGFGGKLKSMGGGLIKGIGLAGKGLKVMGDVGIKALKGVGVAASASVKAIGGIASVATKATGAVMAAGMALTTSVIKGSVSAFAEYQQLEGGMKKLFGDSYHLVMQNANDAYKTAGLSANQYMQQVTQFASKLVEDMGGDTEQAADKANRAIVDMADNVNTYGTSMEAVQNAYRGFAKGNFTMLDNLSLGYGGTKTEMERLLKDASDYLKKTTGEIRTFDISSFADIIDAIHLIQEKNNVAGTTAKEASDTLSGSLSSVKAAWDNLLVSMAGGGVSVKEATKNFTDSAKIMLQNYVPAIKQATQGFGEFVREIAPIVAKELPNLITDILPDLVGAGLDLGSAALKGIAAIFKPKTISKLVKDVGKKAKTKITDFLGLSSDASLSDIGRTIGEKLRIGIESLKTGAKTLLADLLGFDTENLDNIDFAQIATRLGGKLRKAFNTAGVTILNLLGIKDNKGNLVDSFDDIDWDSVAFQLSEKLQNMSRNVRGFLGGALGIEKNGDQVAEWSEILSTVIDKAVTGLQGGNDFLKKLLLGNEKYLDLEKVVGKGNVSWGNVVDELFKDNRIDFSNAINGLLTITVDIAGGAIEAGKSIGETIWKTLNGLVQANEGSLFGDVLGFLRDFIGYLDFFDKDGNFKTPDWVVQILDTLGFLSKEDNDKDGKRDLQVPPMIKSIIDAVHGVLTALGFIVTNEQGQEVFQIPPDLVSFFGVVVDLLTQIADWVAKVAGEDPGVIQGIVGAYMGIKGVSWLTNTKVFQLLTGTTGKAITQQAVQVATQAVSNGVKAVGKGVVSGVKKVGTGAKTAAKAVGEAVKTGGTVVGTFLGDALGLSTTGWGALGATAGGFTLGMLSVLGLGKAFTAGNRNTAYDPNYARYATIQDKTDLETQVNGFLQMANYQGGTYNNPYNSPWGIAVRTLLFNTAKGGSGKSFFDLFNIGEGRNFLEELFNAEGGGGNNPAAAAFGQLLLRAYGTDLGNGVYTNAGERWDAFMEGLDEWQRMAVSTAVAQGANGATAEGYQTLAQKMAWFFGDSGLFNSDGKWYIPTELDPGENAASEISKKVGTVPIAVDFYGFPVFPDMQLPNSGTSDFVGPMPPTGSGVDGHFAKGAWDIPYNNYLANLHRDEMVLTASQARDYREGNNGNSAIVDAIRGLRQDITNLQLVVGQKTFGRAVVNYSGKRMNGYIGEAEDKLSAGYGWG